MNKNHKGQLSIEMAIVIFVIVAALLSIQGYFKRAFQGRLKQAADNIGEQYSFENTTSNITLEYRYSATTITNTTEINGTKNTVTRTTLTSDETQKQWGYEHVAGW